MAALKAKTTTGNQEKTLPHYNRCCCHSYRRKLTEQVNQKMAPFTNFALCLLGIVFSNSFLGVEADTCPRDWLQNQGNCYAFFNEPLTWEEAEAECQSYGRGTHLASILTKAEALLVARYISSYQPRPSTVWIGLHDVRQNGRWRWADESAYNYKAWLPGEPDNTDGDEYCVELLSSTGFKEWNDQGCYEQNAYICKHEL